MMIVKKSELVGKVYANKSKSHIIRLIFIMFLNEGGVIKNISKTNDVLDAYNLLKTLGINCCFENNDLFIEKFDSLIKRRIYIHESATVFRFAAIILSKFFDNFEIEVSDSLVRRKPELLNEYQLVGNVYYFKKISAINMVDISLTSQNLSALLILESFNQDIEISYNGNSSLSYVMMSYEMLKSLGVNISLVNNCFRIKKSSLKYLAIDAEDDFSSFSNLIVMAALHKNLLVKVPIAKYQADILIYEYLNKLGVYFKEENGYFNLEKIEPKQVEISMINNIDMVMPLVSLALFLDVEITFSGIKNLVYKESNRLTSIVDNLEKLGANFSYSDDLIIIKKSVLNSAALNTFNDHRIAMMNLIILSKVGGQINEVKSIKKSFESFIKQFIAVGGVIHDN